jgi:hypothetical protein
VKQLKTFGLAAVLALALAATVGAASASAAIFEIPGAGTEATTTWNGVRLGKEHKLTLGLNVFSCENVALAGGQMKGESTTELTVPVKELGCSEFGLGAIWFPHGCQYRFNPGAGAENPKVGTIDIVGCKEPMSFETAGCRLTIGNQNGLGSVTYTRTESEKVQSVKVAANLSGITYTAKGGGCNMLEGTYSNGTYVGEWTVRPAHFTTEAANATVSYTQSSGAKIFTFPTQANLICGTYDATGSMSALIAESITLTPSLLSSCTSFGGPVSPSMGGCSFKFSGSGAVSIVGAACAGNPITIKSTVEWWNCTITVGPQGPLVGATLTNEGSGVTRKVALGGIALGVKYTASGSSCPGGTGTFSNGEYKPRLRFSAESTKTTGLWIE